jgi:hypothetical protein
MHVEDALFGGDGPGYPVAALPAAACATDVQAGRGPAACAACRAATRVEIYSDPARSCLPSSAATSPQYRPSAFSWEERCEFVADIVQTAYPRLQPALSEALCSCAGCCHEPQPPPAPAAAPAREPMVGLDGGGGRSDPPRFAAADSAAAIRAELDAAIAAAQPGYECLYPPLQEDVWAGSLLRRHDET